MPDISNALESFELGTDITTEANKYCSDPTSYDETRYGKIGEWDVSKVTGVNFLFSSKNDCNPDISAWDVSNFKTFACMFDDSPAFNQDISGWDVSFGSDFEYMFKGAISFNQDIGYWDVSSSTNFEGMFERASSFDQDISSFDVSSIVSFSYMFAAASAFNQDISRWNVSSATDFHGMFDGTSSFHQNLREWPSIAKESFLFCDAGAICDDDASFISIWIISSLFVKLLFLSAIFIYSYKRYQRHVSAKQQLYSEIELHTNDDLCLYTRLPDNENSDENTLEANSDEKILP